jgi:hypothetical protein
MENDDIRFWFEDGILCSEYKKPYDMTLENSKPIYALREEISGDTDQYFCYDISNLKSMSKDARIYGEKHGQHKLKASAVVVNSYLTKMIYNLFLSIHTVKIPVKAFKSKGEAISWLKELREEDGRK